MSADNGIYVIKENNVFKVFYASALDNMDYNKESQEEFYNWHIRDADNYQTKEEAILVAHEMAANIPVLEYGVSYLGDWEDIKKRVRS